LVVYSESLVKPNDDYVFTNIQLFHQNVVSAIALCFAAFLTISIFMLTITIYLKKKKGEK
ncbi:MAG: hypothetical protein ACRC4M_00965, partial [Mycoplasma sp.]